MAGLHHMAYWDDSARYAPSAVIDDADGDTESVISTVDGTAASGKLASDGLAIVETLHDLPEEDGESGYANTDCHMMEVTADSVRWTCLLKHADVRLTTWDVPVRLFETLSDMEETTNVS
jgi:hypothetical protein